VPRSSLRFVLALLLIASASPAFAQGAPATRIHADGIGAVATKAGVAVTARVQLQNTCYQARLQPTATKWEYEVVTQRVPGTEGKMCAMSIIVVTVGIEDAGTSPPAVVRVDTAAGSDTYTVAPSNAWTPAH
jgi:hypothetical protein